MKVDYSKFSNEAIEFAFNQADNLITESISSFQSITDKSYMAFAVYTAILAYYFERLNSAWANYIVFFGAVAALAILLRNLFPASISHKGARRSYLIHEWYHDKPDQIRLMMESMLDCHEAGLDGNLKEVSKRNKLYRYSAIVMVLSFGLSLLFSFLFTC